MSSKSFAYKKADYRYVRHYHDGKWDEGFISEDGDIVLNESACVFQYSQACFEGMKAYRTKEGQIVSFRPDLNAERMYQSCERMVMPVISIKEFIEAVDLTVLANKDSVPAYGESSSMYIRPFMIGTTPTLGVSPAQDFEFRVFVSVVGSYFGKQVNALRLKISDYDRAAPLGTGAIKAGINYGMSLYPLSLAHEEGYDENLYLDPRQHEYVEETGGANIFFVDEADRIIVPRSASILPSLTRRSMMVIAEDYLHLEVIERQVDIKEIAGFKECGLCGTATVIAPVGSIAYQQEQLNFDTADNGYGKVCRQLRDTLLGIQYGEIPAPAGWIHVIG